MLNGSQESGEWMEVEIRPTHNPSGFVPRVGEEFAELQGRLPDGAAEQLRDGALGILRGCVRPRPASDEESTVMLVHGSVQSGKTSSFTTVLALAKDNGYAILIVLAGASITLLKQNRKRLNGRDGLNLSERSDRSWVHIEAGLGAGKQNQMRQQLQRVLSDWHDPMVLPEERQTILITVMKHHKHLQELASVLQTVQPQLEGLGVMIVDDEADQISLNSRVND